jgi:hypothetical protein
MEKIKDYFNRYPQSQEVYENGGVLFHDQGSAESYGKGETTRYTREQLTVNTDPPADDIDSSADDIDSSADDINSSAADKLKGIEDLSTLSYDDLKALVKALNLKPSNQKAETLTLALAEYKETHKDE